MKWKVILSKKAVKDSKNLKAAGLKFQAEKLLHLLSENPFYSPPDYEKLVGNLNGFYSRRINIQHRLIYDIDKKNRIVHVLRMWTHYS
ncbi:Txe/YoeB family addiction module toxin [Desulfobacula sp.]